MRDSKIILNNIFHLDLFKQELSIMDSKDNGLNDYTFTLFEEINDPKKERRFSVGIDFEEVMLLARETVIKNDEFEKQSRLIAEKLLSTEIRVQAEYKNFTKIQKGSLIQSLVKRHNAFYYLIIKVEHSSFLDEEELLVRKGLPFKNKLLKACLLEFNEKFEIIDVIVKDSNNKIAKYWWSDFLGLEETNTDEYNTKNAFISLDHYFNNNLKNNYPEVYLTLRNNTVGYFTTQDHFIMDNYIDNVVGNYEENVKSDLDFKKFKKDLRELSTKDGFDNKFNINKDSIKKDIVERFKLSENLYLEIKGKVKSIESLIELRVEPNGQNVLEIKINDEKTINVLNRFIRKDL